MYKKLSFILIAIIIGTFGAYSSFARIDNPVSTSPRWITMYHGGGEIVATSQAFTANRVILGEFETTAPASVERICYVVGGTSNGNVQGVIYGPIVTEETVLGAPLIASTTSQAQTTINASQCLYLIATTTLPVGRYYVGLQADNGTGTFMRNSNQTQVPGWGQYFDATYGSFVATATTTTNTGTAIPGMYLGVVKP